MLLRPLTTLSLALVILAGCGDDQGAAKPGNAPTSRAPSAGGVDSSQEAGARAPVASSPRPEMQAMSASAHSSAATSSAPVEAAKLTDEQIAKLLDVANDKEIDESKVASRNAKDASVKAFAKMMIDHHGEAKTKLAKVVDAAGLKPAEGADSKKTVDDTKLAVETLGKLQGADFDKAYVDLMTADHHAALDLIEQRVMASVKNADLRKLVETDLKPTIEKHLHAIEDVAKKLGGAAAATSAPVPKAGAPTK